MDEGVSGSVKEDRLRQQGVDALLAVHKLGDTQVYRVSGQHIGVFAAESLFDDQEIEHLVHGDLGGLLKILVEAHGHVMRGSFGAGPTQLHILASCELKGSLER